MGLGRILCAVGWHNFYTVQNIDVKDLKAIVKKKFPDSYQEFANVEHKIMNVRGNQYQKPYQRKVCTRCPKVVDEAMNELRKLVSFSEALVKNPAIMPSLEETSEELFPKIKDDSDTRQKS